MAEPYKRTDSPFFWYAYSDPVTGKRVSRSTGQTKLTEARKVVAGWMREATDRAARGITEEITVAEALRRFVEQERKRGTAGWENHQARAERMSGRVIGRWGFGETFPLARLSAADVERLRTERKAEGYADNTINHEVKTLGRAWRMAKAAGAAVAREEPRFRLFKAVAKIRALSPEEFHAVLKALDPASPLPGRNGTAYVPAAGTKIVRERAEARDLFLALTLTGGRWGEIAKLTWDSVDVIDWSRIRLWGWKTDKERDVPVAAAVRDMLAARRERMKGTVYVFPGFDPKNPDAPRAGPSRAINRALDRAGCNAPHLVARYGRATIHSLRHTFATWQRRAGAGLDEVQDLLGHSDIAMTRVYAHIKPAETVQRATAALDQIVGDGLTN